MPDYYSILWRTLKTGDFDSPQWRKGVFDRTRQVLLDQLRARRPPLSNTEIKLQTDALNAAIRTIQSEFAQTGSQSRCAARSLIRFQTASAGASCWRGRDGGRSHRTVSIETTLSWRE